MGSYFQVQHLANLLATAACGMRVCTSSTVLYNVATIVYVCAVIVLSINGTNVLHHRYLLEKARVMIRL